MISVKNLGSINLVNILRVVDEWTWVEDEEDLFEFFLLLCDNSFYLFGTCWRSHTNQR